jgi:hypothetical protein
MAKKKVVRGLPRRMHPSASLAQESDLTARATVFEFRVAERGLPACRNR